VALVRFEPSILGLQLYFAKTSKKALIVTKLDRSTE
jgi:hypothetical protein